MITFPMPAPPDVIALAMNWHDGQASAFYSVLSTGTIHDADTLLAVSCELGRIARKYLAAPDEIAIATEMEKWCDNLLDKLENAS